jgi:hypothetical protein
MMSLVLPACSQLVARVSRNLTQLHANSVDRRARADVSDREGFGPNMMESDVRIAHEREGARLAREILGGLGYDWALVDEVATISDGHDPRTSARSTNDELVKDADKLQRFSITGVSVACDWFT